MPATWGRRQWSQHKIGTNGSSVMFMKFLFIGGWCTDLSTHRRTLDLTFVWGISVSDHYESHELYPSVCLEKSIESEVVSKYRSVLRTLERLVCLFWFLITVTLLATSSSRPLQKDKPLFTATQQTQNGWKLENVGCFRRFLGKQRCLRCSKWTGQIYPHSKT